MMAKHTKETEKEITDVIQKVEEHHVNKHMF